MSLVFFSSTRGHLINAAHIIAIDTNTHVASLTNGEEFELVFVKNRKIPDTIEFGHPYSYEAEFSWLSSGLSQIAEAVRDK